MAEEEREVTARYFSACGIPLEMVTVFKYLGRLILVTDDNCPAVVSNLARAKTLWRRMLHTLRREGAMPRVSGLFLRP